MVLPVVPVWIETTLDLHYLALYAHYGRITPTLCSKKFKNQQYLKVEFWLSFQRYIIRLWMYYQSENGRRPDLSPTFLSSFMKPLFCLHKWCTWRESFYSYEWKYLCANEHIHMQMDVFAQEALAHLPQEPCLFDFQRLSAQKQRVNRRIRMPVIFQKLNGQSLWTVSRKGNRKQRGGGNEEEWKCREKILTTIQIKTTTTQSWSNGKLEARKEEEVL